MSLRSLVIAVLVIAGALAGHARAEVDVTPVAIDFGALRWNTSSTTPFCIVNTAPVAVQIVDISIAPLAGTLTGEVTRGTMRRQATCGTGGDVVAGFPITLAANESLQVQLTADPMDRVGTLMADVTVTTDLVINPTRHVMVSALSTSGEVTIDPAAMVLDFGPTDLDDGPVTRDLAITNTGTADFELASFTRTANAQITMPLPQGTTVLAPGATLRIPVTYAPVAVAMDATTLAFQIANVLGGPTSGAIAIQGRGADREISITPLQLQFPDTFKNPGATAPVLDVTVANLGEAVLHVTSAAIVGDDQFALLGEPAVEIAGLGSHVFRVRFTPRSVGDTTTTRLVLTNDDDAEPMAEIGLAGTGVARDVAFGPRTIDLGFVGVGAIVRVADVLEVTNRDVTESFSIRTISAADPQFFVYDAGGVAIAPGQLRSFDLGFAPVAAGILEVPARLYLDEDPDAHAIVMLRATAVNVDVHGGGGCSAGGGGGGAPMLLLAAALRRRRRLAATLAALAPLTAAADNVVVGAFTPTPSTTGGGFQIVTPNVGRDGNWVASTILSYATNLLVIDATSEGMPVATDRPIAERWMLVLGGAYAFLDRFEAGLALPTYLQRGASPMTGYDFTDASGGALGDVTLHAKARLWRDTVFRVGVSGHLTLPTATDGQFTGVDLPSGKLLALGDARFERVTFAVMAGALLRQKSVYRDNASISQASGFTFGTSANLRAGERVWITAEIFGEIIAAGRTELPGNELGVSPIEALAGATYRTDHLAISLGVGRGLISGIGAPDLRGVFSIAYTGDAEKFFPLRRVPKDDEDRDGDHLALSDKCPDAAEDFDKFEDLDGCPDLDNDADGVTDDVDRCPNDAEDTPGLGADGCPDADRDGDGLPGADDRGSTASAAEATFDEGRRLMGEGKFAAACNAFEQSQRLDPQFGTQYDLAGCYEKIGKLATASNLYRELGRSDTNADRRARATELAVSLATRVPKIKLVLGAAKPKDIAVFMNDVNANALIDVETPVDFGTYNVAVGAGGFRQWRTSVVVKEAGKVTTVTIDLEAIE